MAYSYRFGWLTFTVLGGLLLPLRVVYFHRFEWFTVTVIHINIDCIKLNRAVMTVLTNRLGTDKGGRLVKNGRRLTNTETALFGNSKMIRYIAGSGEPIYPIGYVQTRHPMGKRRNINRYTPEGRKGLHDKLQLNPRILLDLMRTPQYMRSAELCDNRLSLFSAQFGK